MPKMPGQHPPAPRMLNVQQALEVAVGHHSAGRLAQAEDIYRSILNAAPNHPGALNLLGVVEHQKGNNKAAERLLSKAVGLAPDFPDALNNLGIVYKELGDLKKAVEHYKKVVAIKPDHIDAHNNLGVAFELLGESQNAVFAYQQAFNYRTGTQPTGDVRLSPATNTVFIELTNKCNFHCDFCPSDSQTRAIGFMDVDLVKQNYDAVVQDRLANVVTLHVMGEPTLHPNLIDILKHGAARKIQTELVTNGSTLVPKLVPGILDSLYGTLDVSHMTPTEETYRFRGKVGLSWQRYIENIRYVLRAYMERIANGEPTQCDLILRIMVSKDTAANVTILESDDEVQSILNEWIDYIAELEAELGLSTYPRDALSVEDLGVAGGRKFKKYGLQKGVVIQFWEAFTFANSRVDDSFELEELDEPVFCRHPFKDFAVLWNGDVSLCCLDHDGQLKVGNVNDAPIKDIMYGEEAQALRATMLGQGDLPPLCRTCQERPVQRKGEDREA